MFWRATYSVVRLLLILYLKKSLHTEEDGEDRTGYHDGSCCDSWWGRLETTLTADTHLLSSDQDGNMDIWMIYYRQTLT